MCESSAPQPRPSTASSNLNSPPWRPLSSLPQEVSTSFESWSQQNKLFTYVLCSPCSQFKRRLHTVLQIVVQRPAARGLYTMRPIACTYSRRPSLSIWNCIKRRRLDTDAPTNPHLFWTWKCLVLCLILPRTLC